MKLTKIVATIGPVSQSEEMLKLLLESGVDVVRMNFSHGDHEFHGKTIQNLRKVAAELGKYVGILLDTKGPEIRTGKLENGEAISLIHGQEISVTTKEIIGDNKEIFINYPQLCEDVVIGGRIMIADGLIALEVKEIFEDRVTCIVCNNGTLGEKKNVNLPGVKVQLPSLSEQDKADIVFGIQQQVDYIAASFIRTAQNVAEIKQLLSENGSKQIKIIAKIENQEGLDNIEEIVAIADGIMVARGDLGVDIPLEEVPMAQKRMIALSNAAGKPVITATQMLESMIQHPRPTRAEVTDIANAIFDGTDAVMLSGETAGGKYPLEAVQMMSTVCTRVDKEVWWHRKAEEQGDFTQSIAKGAVETAKNLQAKVIVCASVAGTTVKSLRKYRPQQPLLVLTNTEQTARHMTLVKGAYPAVVPPIEDYESLYIIAKQQVLARGLAKTDDIIVVTGGGSIGTIGVTDMIKIMKV